MKGSKCSLWTATSGNKLLFKYAYELYQHQTNNQTQQRIDYDFSKSGNKGYTYQLKVSKKSSNVSGERGKKLHDQFFLLLSERHRHQIDKRSGHRRAVPSPL